MADVHRFELKNLGRMFRVMSGPGVPGGDHGRYQIRCSDTVTAVSVSYSANIDELRQLHRWVTEELVYRTGARGSRSHER